MNADDRARKRGTSDVDESLRRRHASPTPACRNADTTPEAACATRPLARRRSRTGTKPAPVAQAPSAKPQRHAARCAAAGACRDHAGWSMLPPDAHRRMRPAGAGRASRRRQAAALCRLPAMPAIAELKGRPIGRVLTKMGKVTREQVVEALDFQKSKGGALGRILIDLGYVKETDLNFALAAQRGYELVSLEGRSIHAGDDRRRPPADRHHQQGAADRVRSSHQEAEGRDGQPRRISARWTICAR